MQAAPCPRAQWTSAETPFPSGPWGPPLPAGAGLSRPWAAAKRSVLEREKCCFQEPRWHRGSSCDRFRRSLRAGTFQLGPGTGLFRGALCLGELSVPPSVEGDFNEGLCALSVPEMLPSPPHHTTPTPLFVFPPFQRREAPAVVSQTLACNTSSSPRHLVSGVNHPNPLGPGQG